MDEDVTDPLLWWISHQSQYPILSKLALSMLAIPAQSAEAERVFSTMSQVVPMDRHSLIPHHIEEEVLSIKWYASHPELFTFNTMAETEAVDPMDISVNEQSTSNSRKQDSSSQSIQDSQKSQLRDELIDNDEIEMFTG